MGHTWVYIMLRADGLRKLGCTIDVTARRTQLYVQTGVKHVLETAWKMPDAEGRMTERLAHLKLKPMRATDCNSIECYPMSRAVITEAVLWATRHAKELCEAEAPGELTDDQVLAIAAGEAVEVLRQQATRGAVAWREMVRKAQISADEVIPDDEAEQMLADFHAFCMPDPGRMIRQDGQFIYLDPGSDLHEIKISRRHLERIIDGAKRRLPV